MAKEFSTIVDQAIKDLCVKEESLLFTTSGGITKDQVQEVPLQEGRGEGPRQGDPAAG